MVENKTSPSGQQDRPPCFKMKKERCHKDGKSNYWHPSECIYHKKEAYATEETLVLSSNRRKTRKSTTTGRTQRNTPMSFAKDSQHRNSVVNPPLDAWRSPSHNAGREPLQSVRQGATQDKRVRKSCERNNVTNGTEKLRNSNALKFSEREDMCRLGRTSCGRSMRKNLDTTTLVIYKTKGTHVVHS